MVMLILLITKQSPVTVIHPWRSSETWENHLSSIIRMSGSQGIYRNPFLHHDTKHPRLARLPKPWIFVAHHSNHGKPGVLVHRSVGTAAKRHEFLPARLPWTSWQAQLHSLFDGKVTSFFRNQRFLRMERSPHTKKKSRCHVSQRLLHTLPSSNRSWTVGSFWGTIPPNQFVEILYFFHHNIHPFGCVKSRYHPDLLTSTKNLPQPWNKAIPGQTNAFLGHKMERTDRLSNQIFSSWQSTVDGFKLLSYLWGSNSSIVSQSLHGLRQKKKHPKKIVGSLKPTAFVTNKCQGTYLQYI